MLLITLSSLNCVAVKNCAHGTNYDEQYHGLVTIEYALVSSLNIVAVKTLHKIKTHKFVKALKKMGFAQIRKDEKKLGLSVLIFLKTVKIC